MSNPASILVGCGGSGIRTLLRLNALLAEDPYWRHRIGRDIYYVLLDTEMDMIDEFESIVHRQLEGVDKPLIWSLRVAQGHVIMQPIVKKHFHKPFASEDVVSQKGKERLYSHWWSHPELGPFTAPKVRPLTKGAGQCPAVSYFLTWNHLLKVEDIFDRLIHELIGRRSVEGDDPLAELNFCIVAGLAGGTGRGSWQLVAFKVRELLTARYGIPAPMAYLYDASVFENVYRRRPRQETPMKVNALTGISELSVWMKNLESAGKPVFQYQLPSMERPADPEMDVLNVDLDLDTSAAAPVDNAVMVFGGNNLAVLDNNTQYHEMVGTGLYAALSRGSITAQRINESPPYQSLGTATFEVNAVTLRRYFEGLNRIQALRVLEAHDDAAVETAADRFLGKNHLRINVTKTNRRGFSADEKGSVLQRTCQRLLKLYSDDMTSLGIALEEDEPATVEAVVHQLLQPHDQRAEQAVQMAVDTLDYAPEDAARSDAMELFRQTRSIANVRRFVEVVVRELERELDALPSADRMRVEHENNPLELVEHYKSREYFGLAGPHFNEDERLDLEAQTQRAVLYANYGVICEQLRRRYKSWIAIVRRWQDSAEQILAVADKLTAKFKNEVAEDIDSSGSSYDDFFNTLFCDAEAPEKSIPDEFAKGRFYRRELKPAMRRRGDLELLGEPEFSKELHGVVVSAMMDAGLSRDSYDELDKLARDLELSIRKTVSLPFEFIEEHFSIQNVIANLRQAWLRRLHESRGQADKVQGLISRFSTFFGVQPKRDGDAFSLPDREGFILNMGASLAATCRPYWRLRDDAHTEIARVSLFLPVSADQFDQEGAERFIQERLRRADVTVEVYTDQRHEDESLKANPFIMIAYAVEGVQELGKIASLDYWQTPTVKSLLMECERSEDPAIFDQTADHNGVSFTDPLFVSDEHVRQARWKPWIENDANQELITSQTLDAMLYALMKPQGAVADKLAECGWSLPLIGRKRMQWYEFTRRALVWGDDGPHEDTGCPWRARAAIGQGADELKAVLQGAGRKDGGLKSDGPKWAERVRQESRLFWDSVMTHIKAPPGSELHEQLMADMETQLDAEAQKCDPDDPCSQVWAELLERAKAWRKAE